MRKLNDVLEESNEELALFLNTNNLFFKNIENIDLLDIYQYKKTDTLYNVLFHFYGGFTEQEQFIVTKVILPLFLIFNEISNVADIKPNKYLKIPEQHSLLAEAYIYDELEQTIEDSLSFSDNITNLPGINKINKYNNSNKNIKNNTLNVGIPGLDLKQEKVTYDKDTGIIYY